MAKSHGKENRKGTEHNENVLLLRRNPLSSNDAGSPKIRFQPEFFAEAFDLSSSFSPAMFNPKGTPLSLRQAIREKKVAYLWQYSEAGYDLNVVDATGFTPLHHAASENSAEVVSMLLDCQVNVDCLGKQLLTPLHVAVRYNSLDALKVLLECNANPSFKNADGATPLHFAARRSCVDTSKLLLNSALSSVNSPDHSGMTPFLFACVRGNLELCELFMEYKADIKARTVEEKTPLHLAALRGNEAVVELLIKKALFESGNPMCYINAPDFEGSTPLHLACQKGHVETARLLLGYGADVVQDDNQWDLHSPLHLAAANGHMTVVELLISHDSPVNCRDQLQKTPLHRAAEFDRVDIVKYLLEVGAGIETKDIANRTAFICAVKRGRTRTAELLLESGANYESRDDSLRTCIHLAVQYKRVDTLRMLLNRDQGILINERDKDLQTPLHYAARLGILQSLQILLGKNCVVAPMDVLERSPLHAAAENGNVSCVEELCLSEPGHINDKDERGLTPLHLAARKSQSETCSVLLHMGAHTMMRDSNRWTALHHCAAGGCVRTAEALLIYHSTLPLEATDQEGNTPLHVAAKCGHVSIVQLMLSRGADITVCNKQNMTCLDVAIESGKEKVAEVLIKNNKWKEILQCKADRGFNPMKSLIQTMPKVAEKVMNKCITFSDLLQCDPEYSVTFDFSLLAPYDGDSEGTNKSGENRFFGPAVMVESEREDLLSHPLSQALLRWKWTTVGQPLFWCNFLTHLAFVCLFTAFTVTERENASNEDDKMFTFSTGTPVVIVIFICIHMLKEIYQMTIQQWRYFTHFTNLIDWCCYITALLYLMPYVLEKNIFWASKALWPLACIAILLSYLSLVLFLRRFTYFGLNVSMFLEVTKTFVRVVFVFTPIVVSFSLVFFLLLQERDSFCSVWWSFLKTSIMMVGEIDYDDHFVDKNGKQNENTMAPCVPTPEFSAIIVFFFCMMVSVLLMNFLVGLAVGDIDSIQRDANMRRLAMQVEFATDIDQRYPRLLRKHFQKSVMVLKPNNRNRLAFMFKMIDGLDNRVDVTDDEPKESEVSAEVAKQREHIKRLQSAMEDQSRLLQEISQQLKVGAR